MEDFGEDAGELVQIGQQHIVDAARRWAVSLCDGSLVFVDSADMSPADVHLTTVRPCAERTRSADPRRLHLNPTCHRGRRERTSAAKHPVGGSSPRRDPHHGGVARLDAAALCADIRYSVPCGRRMGNRRRKV